MASLNPYAELGVAADATAAAVRSAYRKRAKETHPDHGGNPAAFARTKTASIVLLDPAKRVRFDRDGVIDDDPPDNALSEALVSIAQLLEHAIVQCAQHGREPHTADLLEMMRGIGQQAKAGLSQRKRDVEKHLAWSEQLRGRFKLRKRVDGGNRVAALLDQRIAAQQATIAKCGHEIGALDRALTMLADYSFEREPPPLSRGMAWLGNSTTR